MSSITDLGVGQYKVNFETPLSTESAVLTTSYPSVPEGSLYGPDKHAGGNMYSKNSAVVNVWDFQGGFIDAETVSLAFPTLRSPPPVKELTQ